MRFYAPACFWVRDRIAVVARWRSLTHNMHAFKRAGATTESVSDGAVMVLFVVGFGVGVVDGFWECV